MSELTIKDFCPNCGKKTIVYTENDDGAMYLQSCQHCGETLGDLPWQEKRWLIARMSKLGEAE